LWAFPLPDLGLLFDENLAAALVPALSDLYPSSAHVTAVGLAAGRDRAIWDYAGANGLVLVTKDEDFHRLSVLLGAPPKVIWIRLGNCSTTDIARVLRSRHREILGFVEHPEATFLALG
jgi:predicted nuclease of predicted toxin-antitoxin system